MGKTNAKKKHSVVTSKSIMQKTNILDQLPALFWSDRAWIIVLSSMGLLLIVLLVFAPRQKKTLSLVVTPADTHIGESTPSYTLNDRPTVHVAIPPTSYFGLVSVDTHERFVLGKDKLAVTLINPQGFQVPLSIAYSSKLSRAGNGGLVSKAYAQEASPATNGLTATVAPDFNGGLTITLPSLTQLPDMIAGNYRVEVDWQKDGQTYASYEDFSWGVLVMNANQDVYEKGEKAVVGIGMVDNRGNTICNASITAVITSPSGKKQTLKTIDQSSAYGKLTSKQLQDIAGFTNGLLPVIVPSSTCAPQSVTETPDYFFAFQTTETGKYTVTLQAQTQSGVRSLTQQIVVVDQAPFIISRQTASRIYPKATYPMKLTITAKDGYTGNVAETLPISFQATCDDCTELVSGQKKYLTWQVNIAPGKTKELDYTYKAPDVSPAFYILGPLTVGTYTEQRVWYIAADSLPTVSNGPRTATSSSNCTDDSSTGSTAWTSPGNAAAADSVYATVSLPRRTGISHYINCQNFGFTTSMIPTGSVIEGIVMSVTRETGGGTVKDNAVRLIKGGTIGTTDRSTTTSYPTTPTNEDHGGSADLWGTSWGVSDVTASNFGAAFSSSNTTNASETVSVDVIQITIYYQPPLATPITQRHYIFQDDDGANVNSNTNNGSADTALTNVHKGERIVARFQLDNTGSNGFTSGQYELYYDHNDGIWSKVQGGTAVNGGGSGCAVSSYTCTTVDSANDVGQYSALAIDHSGRPWIAESDNTNSALRVAQYVGSGGTGCASTAWTCSTILPSSSVGIDLSIAFDPSGTAWISYYAGGFLSVAKYVGSGGTLCAVATWNCTTIHAAANGATSLGFDNNSNPWISYEGSGGILAIAQYVGSGGTCTSTAWNCTTVDLVASTNLASSNAIAFNLSGTAWIAYSDDTNLTLKVAQYVGSGGTGCVSSAWTCTVVDSTEHVGSYNSIAFDPSGNAWISYYDSTGGDLRVAQYVNSGGTGCTSTAWTCTSVDTNGTVGDYTHMAFDPTGTAWISYHDGTNGHLKVVQYVGSGGTGCAVSSWACTTIDSNTAVGLYTSLAFGVNGNAWISYYDSTNGDLKIVQYQRASEIIPGYGVSGSNGDALTSADAGTCQGGTSYSNGTWQDGTNVSTATTLPANKCTEVAFVIDTSQATDGTTYRLALRNKTYGSGLTSYSVYPTFTIVSSGNDTLRSSKDDITSYATCTSTSWGCQVADKITATGGAWSSITFDANGNPWVAMYSFGTTTLVVANYVGTGGNCTNSTAWNCTTVDSSGNTGSNANIATAPDGTIWVSYRDETAGALKIAANAAKTGLSSCSASGWYCTTVDTNGGNLGYESQLAFDLNGNPWISYDDTANTAIKVAQYVGSGGTCTSTAWNCTTVDTIGTNSLDGDYGSIAFDSYGNAWVSYNDGTDTALKLATNGGGFGSACTGAGWTCGIVDNTGTSTGQYTSIAIDKNNTIWISYMDVTNNQVRVAQYVGSGGNCTSTAFNCSAVDAVSSLGANDSIVIGPDSNPRLLFYGSGNILRYARYIGGSSGTGCGNSTAWNCTTVDSSVDAGSHMLSRALALDRSGVPNAVYYDNTNSQYKVAKLLLPEYANQVRYKLDNKGYTNIATNDTNYDPMAATTNTPLYSFDVITNNNTANISPKWIGKSNVAASTDNLHLQVYRFGSTNTWTTPDSSWNNSTCSANTDCTIQPTAVSTNLSEYYDSSGSQYILHFRVYQDAGSSQTLQTNYFTGTPSQTLSAVFLNPTRSLTASSCGGAAQVFTLQLQNASGNPTTPTDTTIIQITSDSGGYTVYSDASCTNVVSSGNLTFTTSDSSQSFYIVDSVTGSHTVTATKQSGSDTIGTVTQTYLVGSVPGTVLRGGIILKGGTKIQ